MIGVYGDAARDADFTSAGDRVRYAVDVATDGPFTVSVELRYQPIGFRWAHNLEPYNSPEPKRFVTYYKSMASASSIVVATATSRVESSASR